MDWALYCSLWNPPGTLGSKQKKEAVEIGSVQLYLAGSLKSEDKRGAPLHRLADSTRFTVPPAGSSSGTPRRLGAWEGAWGPRSTPK